MDMIDEMEQYSQRNSIRIHHPDWIENNKENCMSLVCNYAKDHHSTLKTNDIDACHRVGKMEPGRVRPIIVNLLNEMTGQSFSAPGESKEKQDLVYSSMKI